MSIWQINLNQTSYYKYDQGSSQLVATKPLSKPETLKNFILNILPIHRSNNLPYGILTLSNIFFRIWPRISQLLWKIYWMKTVCKKGYQKICNKALTKAWDFKSFILNILPIHRANILPIWKIYFLQIRPRISQLLWKIYIKQLAKKFIKLFPTKLLSRP